MPPAERVRKQCTKEIVPRFATPLKSMAQNTPSKTSTRSDGPRYKDHPRFNAMRIHPVPPHSWLPPAPSHARLPRASRMPGRGSKPRSSSDRAFFLLFLVSPYQSIEKIVIYQSLTETVKSSSNGSRRRLYLLLLGCCQPQMLAMGANISVTDR